LCAVPEVAPRQASVSGGGRSTAPGQGYGHRAGRPSAHAPRGPASPAGPAGIRRIVPLSPQPASELVGARDDRRERKQEEDFGDAERGGSERPLHRRRVDEVGASAGRRARARRCRRPRGRLQHRNCWTRGRSDAHPGVVSLRSDSRVCGSASRLLALDDHAARSADRGARASPRATVQLSALDRRTNSTVHRSDR
jgi:hypothetical protein